MQPTSQAATKLPFSGLRILDVTRVLASPFGTYHLGLLGADVIKIEDPVSGGDPMRYRAGDDPALATLGMATNFLSMAANKKSITLNLRTTEGQHIFRQLASTADAVVENLRAGSMDGYGLGYSSLRKTHPRLLYCSLTGYGSSGPKKRHPAYDPVIQAASGMMSTNGTPDTAPLKIGSSVIDYSAGLATAFALVTALYHRERTGEGQFIDVSMLEVALTLIGNVVTEVLTSGAVPQALGNTSGRYAPVNAGFRAKDALLWVGATLEHQVASFWRAIGREDLFEDDRFSTHKARTQNWKALTSEIESALQKRTAQEWEELLNDAGVPAMRVRTIPDALQQPQVQSRSFLHRFTDCPGIGSATVPLLPFILSETPGRVTSPPPKLGEHTAEILGEIGYSAEKLAALKKAQVI